MSEEPALNCDMEFDMELDAGTITCGLITTDMIKGASIYTDKIRGLMTVSSPYHDGYNLDLVLPIEIVRQTNCKNCGAVLDNNHCDYCGSEY